MQNTQAEQAALALGVNPVKIEVMGDPKYDALQPMTQAEQDPLRQTFKLATDSLVWIAGSTHAGEEKIILNAHQKLMEKYPDLILILAPRRMERVEEIARLLKSKNFSFAFRSSLKQAGPHSVILLDTMGELAQVYALGQVAFVGNSLVKPGGGHSLIEPLSHGLAVLHGPYIENIGPISEMAHSQGLALQVKNSEELSEKVQALLENKIHRQELAEKAHTLIAQQQGASIIMASLITHHLKN